METFSQRLKDLEARSMDRQRIKPIEISQRMDFAADIGLECFRVGKQYRVSITCYAEFWSDDEHLVFQQEEEEALEMIRGLLSTIEKRR